MKVKIGPYKSWFGPYQLASKLLCFSKDDDLKFRFGEFLAHGEWKTKEERGEKLDTPLFSFEDLLEKEKRHETWLYKFLLWVDSKKKRNIKIHIDNYDVWNADSTLSLIIHPILLKLKEVKHGYPLVADEDVPENLRSTNAEPKENEWDLDSNASARWEWVLDEMIWAFEQKVNDEDYETQAFYDKETYRIIDEEGLKSYHKRISNGCLLFGKYFSNLWD